MKRSRWALVILIAAALIAVPGRQDAGLFQGDATGEADALAETAAQSLPSTEELPAVTTERLRQADIADIPITFEVRNTNTSEAACNTDGQTYRVRGHLTGPATALENTGQAVTLYQHGLSTGEWYWRMDVPGYHFTEEMAKRGHVSVTIDRLGYDSSDTPDGLLSCLGGQADITHQIVQALRSGDYTAEGGEQVPSFDRVVLAGHHNGAQIAQIEAYSYGDVDGLVIMNWADQGVTDEASARFFSALSACMQGGSPAEAADDPDGYGYFDIGERQFLQENFADTEQVVLDLAVPLQNRHPCGDMASQLETSTVDLRHLDEIDVPVLFAYGDADQNVQEGPSHRALFTGTDDTELISLAGAGHYSALSREPDRLHDALASWLDRHQLG
ncbi:alpha/beta hydrolase [Allostreptomyces psammosilenae]|uniref:Pimeloyl-ACP methyl ester carboxylesterase n=1 Tax=Allostreptomyces psammosilenae TaxID=1892865 RepID=A0A852ZNS8_9ACTN|nr:alpha/beta hydrolase [Allostreptomyces psammosilenae]NYI03345.1 pimeloyl-ACP methyl ester carboxylesterase [Allostreptomyces psammosilenae]